jgi:hypothetical protein
VAISLSLLSVLRNVDQQATLRVYLFEEPVLRRYKNILAGTLNVPIYFTETLDSATRIQDWGSANKFDEVNLFP